MGGTSTLYLNSVKGETEITYNTQGFSLWHHVHLLQIHICANDPPADQLQPIVNDAHIEKPTLSSLGLRAIYHYILLCRYIILYKTLVTYRAALYLVVVVVAYIHSMS